MRPRIGGVVWTPDGYGFYEGPLQPHGMALVRFTNGAKALYDPKQVSVLTLYGIAKASQFTYSEAAKVERLLNAPTVSREGD